MGCGCRERFWLVRFGRPDRNLWSYRTIADRIRTFSVQPRKDLHELFGRIAFNILVRNTDDHPRNTGFLVEDGGVSLSPLYDVVPAITQRGVGTEFRLAMAFGEKGRVASLENLCSGASSFNLSEEEARTRTEDLGARVQSCWRTVFSDFGFGEKELSLLSPSFELE